MQMAERNFVHKLMALAVLAAMSVDPAFAETRTSKEEAAGVGIGATVGVFAGGPVGAIVGAAAGAWLGDRFSLKKQEVMTLSGSMDQADNRIGSLEQELQRANDERRQADEELARLRALARPELLSLMQSGIEMDLLFRTDEYVLADTTGSRLTQLATTLAALPDVHIQLDGFADERGNAAYNQALSTRRADHVRDLLTAAGVTASRIKVTAHGESPAIDGSSDSYALDRRVSLTLYVDDTMSYASNPN
jgi:outer membrane protein OmpA-like peptidoglycan-associated protein